MGLGAVDHWNWQELNYANLFEVTIELLHDLLFHFLSFFHKFLLQIAVLSKYIQKIYVFAHINFLFLILFSHYMLILFIDHLGFFRIARDFSLVFGHGGFRQG